MQRLAGARELLDGPLDARMLAGNLRDLARVNRWLGGTDLSWRAVEPFVRVGKPGVAIRVIDIGTGLADIPRGLLRRAGDRRLKLEMLATDVRPEIVELARRASAGVPSLDVRLAAADRIDAPDRSFEVVHASLVLHHLDPQRATALLAEMGRVASRAVIVNDLNRGSIWWIGAWLLAHVASGNRYTRHDAPLSVRRAYRADEMSALGRAAGLRELARHHDRLGYRYAIVFVPAAGSDG